jgi:hypothetical protein
MNHLRGWGLLLAIGAPLLVLFSWSRLGSETSRINLERYGEWSAGRSMLELMLPLQQHYAKYKRPAGPGDVQLPPVPKESGVKSWSIEPDTVLRVELNAKDDGRPVVLQYVPIVHTAASVNYDCVSAAPPVRVGRFCRADTLHSQADIPAQLAANEQALQNLPPIVNAAGAVIAPGAAGSVLVVPANVASLESCGYQCVKPQGCVTPRPLACGRLVHEGNTTRFEITATDEAFTGSRFATLAEADQVCEQAGGPGTRVLRATSVSGYFNKLAGGNEYWVHDELRPANNCWSSAAK